MPADFFDLIFRFSVFFYAVALIQRRLDFVKILLSWCYRSFFFLFGIGLCFFRIIAESTGFDVSVCLYY